MRSIVGVLVVIVVLAGTSTAEDIYRWKDPTGGLHLQNVPTPGQRSVLLDDSGSAGSETSADATSSDTTDVAMSDGGETPKRKKLTPEQEEDFSTEVSMRRATLEKELRGTEKRLRDVDGRLATLQRARLKNVNGSAATGGVGAPAYNVLSPEEEALVEERDELAQRAVEVRNDAVHLRQEVEDRLGSVPAWWTDLR
jgi:hypothetical protein